MQVWRSTTTFEPQFAMIFDEFLFLPEESKLDFNLSLGLTLYIVDGGEEKEKEGKGGEVVKNVVVLQVALRIPPQNENVTLVGKSANFSVQQEQEKKYLGGY